jgi:hypothetical protein
MYTSLTNMAAIKFYCFFLYAECITGCRKVDEINYSYWKTVPSEKCMFLSCNGAGTLSEMQVQIIISYNLD